MRPFLLLASLLLFVTPACGGAEPPSPRVGSIIVGVTTDLRVGVDLDALHVVMRAAGAVVTDETLSVSSATQPLVLPAELPFSDLPGGTAVEVSLEGFAPGSDTVPILTRLAATTVVAGEKLLLQVVLDSRCVDEPGSSAPACASPETCVAGQCADEHVAASTLMPYASSWATDVGDPCKPPGAGAPVVIVGQGQADYLPMMDGDVAQVEEGPQGGHHIWVALRTKNLRQSGSITSLTGHFPDLDVDVGPFNVIFTQDVDEGGYCKLFGLRFQLDEQVNISGLLGHPLDVTATMTDPDKAIGVGKLRVVLSSTFTQ